MTTFFGSYLRSLDVVRFLSCHTIKVQAHTVKWSFAEATRAPGINTLWVPALWPHEALCPGTFLRTIKSGLDMALIPAWSVIEMFANVVRVASGDGQAWGIFV